MFNFSLFGVRFDDASEFLSWLKESRPDHYQALLVAVQDATQEELDAIKLLQVAHFGDA